MNLILLTIAHVSEKLVSENQMTIICTQKTYRYLASYVQCDLR